MDKLWNNFVPTASAICGLKTELSGLKPYRNLSYHTDSLWGANLTADEEDPDGRNSQIRLADRTPYVPIPCISNFQNPSPIPAYFMTLFIDMFD
jgi:hypothetical protein